MRKAIRNIASIVLVGLLILPQVLLLSHSHEHSNTHVNTIHQDDSCAVCDLFQHSSFDALEPETFETGLRTAHFSESTFFTQVFWYKTANRTIQTRGPPALS